MSEADPATPPGRTERTRLSSVAAAIRLLKTFSEQEREIGISALAQRLGLAKSSVHRLVTTLVTEGMLEQNRDTGRYRLGLTMLEMGAVARRSMTLSSEARAFLFELRAKAQETVLLSVRDRAEIVHLVSLESDHAIRLQSAVGTRKPLLGAALGRAIVAFLPDDQIAVILAEAGRAKPPRAGVDPAEQQIKLRDIRERGYATEDQESEAGMRCVAAPIFAESGGVVGSVGLAGPVQRLSFEALADLAEPLLETAASISRRMGSRGTAAPRDY